MTLSLLLSVVFYLNINFFYRVEGDANQNYLSKETKVNKTSLFFGNKPSKKSHQILIVDDTPLNLLILETFIKAENDSNIIFKAYNGEQAIELAIQKKKIDLILMDCNMPLMDGYEATIKLRGLMEDKIVQECPILAISAYCKSGEDNNWREAGMNEFLEKPLTKKKFQEMYRRWLGFNKDF